MRASARRQRASRPRLSGASAAICIRFGSLAGLRLRKSPGVPHGTAGGALDETRSTEKGAKTVPNASGIALGPPLNPIPAGAASQAEAHYSGCWLVSSCFDHRLGGTASAKPSWELLTPPERSIRRREVRTPDPSCKMKSRLEWEPGICVRAESHKPSIDWSADLR